MAERFDLAVVGAGIVGLAQALAGVRAGLRVVVVERERRAIGASVRNFGFVTVTGQAAGITWRRARRSRDVWAEIAGPAGIAVVQRHLLVVARRAEALAVLEAFLATEMGVGCELRFGGHLPPMLAAGHAGALFSPHELRVESRTAIPRLAAWLAGRGVTFRRAAALGVETGRLHTSAGAIAADGIAVCPGSDLATLFAREIAARGVTLCKLHMLRLADPGWRLPAAVMSDLGLVRYLGYAAAPALPALRARLAAEQAGQLADGIHLIAVQSADGSLVVGDSHHYDDSPDPFQPRAVDDRILEEFAAVFGAVPAVTERWTGTYPSGPDVAFHETPMDGVRLVMVTSGTGASTAFALGEEVVAGLFDLPTPEHAR